MDDERHQEETAARWARIDRRADQRKKRTRPRVSIAALRIAELSRLFLRRYGPQLPDDDAGKDDVELIAHHFAALSKNPRDRILDWIAERAPWMSAAEAGDLAARVLEKRIRWRADSLALRLGLSARERHDARITTIGAIDETKAERAIRRKILKAETARAARLAQGRKPRREYETTSAAATKPWLVLGLSRRTWYRHRAIRPRRPGRPSAAAAP